MRRRLASLFAVAAVGALTACPPPPPSLEGLVIEIVPSEPAVEDDLVAMVVVHAAGSNKDTFRYSYDWSVDGVDVDDLTGREVPAERTADGEVWAVRATPWIDWLDETLVGVPSDDEVTVGGGDDDDAADDDDVSDDDDSAR